MAVTCEHCKTPTYQVVDEEKDVKGRAFVLLECRTCRRTIILPEPKWREGQAAKG